MGRIYCRSSLENPAIGLGAGRTQLANIVPRWPTGARGIRTMPAASLAHPSHWRGTKVPATEGRIEPGEYILPSQFGEFLNSKAGQMAELNATISDRQREKIDEAFWVDLDRVAESDSFRAMDNDVRLFGRAAFTRSGTSGEDEP